MLLWLIIILLALLIPTAYAGWIGAPYAPTLLPAVRRTFDEIGLGPDDFLVDLGAGDGKIVREAAARGARALGIELSPILWAVAKLRTLGRARARIVFGNFYRPAPTNATVLFAFLMPNNMPRVRRWLKQQYLPRGRYFLAYAFPLADVQPLRVVKVPNCAPVYVYDIQELTSNNKITKSLENIS